MRSIVPILQKSVFSPKESKNKTLYLHDILIDVPRGAQQQLEELRKLNERFRIASEMVRNGQRPDFSQLLRDSTKYIEKYYVDRK